MSRAGLLAALLATTACSTESGTIRLGLVTAPSSNVLDAVTRLRITLTAPRQVISTERGENGFAVALDVEATGVAGQLIVEGFDASDSLVASGQSPPFAVAALDADIAIYMAAPMSVQPAPVTLSAARSEIVVAAVNYGAILVGGRDAVGAASGEVAVYNAFVHDLELGAPLPAARVRPAVAATGGALFLFGGADDTGPTGTLWRFDTTVAPAGEYTELPAAPALARAGELMLPLNDGYLVTGAPPLILQGGAVTPEEALPALPAAGATVVTEAGEAIAIVAGPSGVFRYRDGAVDALAMPGPTAPAVAALPGGRVAITRGADLLVVDATAGTIETRSNALATARTGASAAATQRHLVVAGGRDPADAPIGEIEVFDVTTLAPLARIPATARAEAFAVALANDQVLLGGGGEPSALLELFTPPPPP